MYLKCLLCCLIVLVLNESVFAGEHKAGTLQPGDRLAYDKAIFLKNTNNPTNYTVIFKYLAPESSHQINYVLIRTLSQSNATVEIKQEPGKERFVQSIINIINGTDVSIMASIYKASISMNLFALDRNTRPKVFIVGYAHNTTQTRDRKINLGQRQQGDEMIGFESKNVTLKNRFAEHEFLFNAPNKFITSVGFSFSTPTAVAFVNSTFLKKDSLDVIVYDLNSPYFIANMSVYGFHYAQVGADYKPIVKSQKIDELH